jgi:hypothetical protein
MDPASKTYRILFLSIVPQPVAGNASGLMELQPVDNKNLTLRDYTGDKIFQIESIIIK